MTNIILCGGSGTRLWPVSRKLMPKQFVQLFENKSLFQKTLLRNRKFSSAQLIVINQEQVFLAENQIADLNLDLSTYNFVLEPVGRNTAPAIALACFSVKPDEVVLVTPSDHLVKNEQAYEQCAKQGIELANENNIVTFGIKAIHPETGYGYIETQKNQPDLVKSFKEKPDQKTAQAYLESGNYYWNSGIFCFKAGVFLDSLKKYSPAIYENSQKAFKACGTFESRKLKVALEDMQKIPENSIDYAVMEAAAADGMVRLVPSDIDWSDLGSFDSLYEEESQDNNKNAMVSVSGTEGTHKPIVINSKNNLVVHEGRQIALIDVDDLHVIDTDDALLISKRGSSQKVKDVVGLLKKESSDLPNTHLTVHRPWGTYTILEESQFYKIKRIVVKPEKRLSLQKHFHRNEHWVVVSGSAHVQIADKEQLVRANESTYIPMGQVHRLENKGKIDLVMIEVQVGEYLGEDDIVRLKDDYDRS